MDEARIVVSAEAVSIEPPGGFPLSCPWAEVEAVLLSGVRIPPDSTLLLYLTLEHESGTVLEANKRMPGWNALVAALPEHLPIDAEALAQALRDAEDDPSERVLFERA